MIRLAQQTTRVLIRGPGSVSAVLIGLLANPVMASAQIQPETRLAGRVLDNKTGQSIEAAEVYLLDLDNRQLDHGRTTSDGRFEFLVHVVPAVRLRVQKPGFKDALTPPLHFESHAFYDVEIRLDADIILLAPLEVVARAAPLASPGLAGFEFRRAKGVGRYITRQEIEQRRPGYVTDMLLSLPGIRLVSDGPGHRRVITMGRRGCPSQLFVDGFLINPPGGPVQLVLDDAVIPESIEGIEIYDGFSTIPAEFLTPAAACGVIVVWTRRGR